jgi:hypothetical protein
MTVLLRHRGRRPGYGFDTLKTQIMWISSPLLNPKMESPFDLDLAFIRNSVV